MGRCRNAGELQVRWRELLGSVVEMKLVQRSHDPGQSWDRIVGAMRIGDMALGAGHVDPHVDRAAPADLDRVAQSFDRGRLANQDHVGPDPALVEPVDDARRAIGGIALFIAGDQQGDGSSLVFEIRDGRDKGGNGAFHVVGAASGQHAIGDHWFERVAVPAIAGRNDIEMPGKAEMRRAGSARCNHILGRTVGGLAHHPAVHIEPVVA